MSNILLNYMKRRLDKDMAALKKNQHTGGPVVTISREYGCPAKRLAAMLTSRLNKIEKEKYTKNTWQWISKEILEESAKELNLKSDMVRDVANKETSGVVDDIIMSLSHKHYPGDQKVKKTCVFSLVSGRRH